jgi:hypothetical protein
MFLARFDQSSVAANAAWNTIRFQTSQFET